MTESPPAERSRCPFARLGFRRATSRGEQKGHSFTNDDPTRVGLAGGGSDLKRLKWAAILAPFLFVALLEWARYLLYPALLSWHGRLLMDAVILLGMLFFYGAFFTVFAGLQDRLVRQNRELLALHEAGLNIYGDLELDSVLQKVVDRARLLLEARYGAVSVMDEEGRIQSFVTSGISAEERARIGPPPEGRGLLGVVLREGQRLRIPDISKDPRAVGFPSHHPRMHSLLAVPILCKGPFRGNLYVAQKEGALGFSQEDEETLVRFATKAAIAIDNAHLHQRLRALAVAEERLRIAHEMHDGMAQVLAYVNTKAQAVQEFLRQGRTAEADRHLEQLAAAAREVYEDVREGILGLRVSSDVHSTFTDALREYLRQWETQSGLAGELLTQDPVRLDPGVEIQLLRIVQEALTNIRKHAQAHRARVRVERTETRLFLAIEDDGVGFNADAQRRRDLPRFGLATMKERAESIGGVFRLETAPGRGTRIEVELPAPATVPTGERSPYASADR